MTSGVVHWSNRRVFGLPVVDVVLALLMCGISVASTSAGHPDLGPTGLSIAVAAVMSLALAWRTRATLVATTAISGAVIVQGVMSRSPVDALWGLVVVLIMMFSIASGSNAARATLGGIALTGAVFIEEWHSTAVDYVFMVLVLGGAWIAGRASRAWRAQVERAERERDEGARLAVAEERLRIARELHDVVAHGLSVIAVQADAADAALKRDPALAVAPVQAIHRSARSALSEMRTMLDVLRTTHDEARPLPQPSVADIPALVETMRAAGLPVTLELPSELPALTADVGLSTYRIVQEALTNALKHSGAEPAHVQIRMQGTAIHLEINNTVRRQIPAENPSGRGLIGISERAAALGGLVEFGAVDDEFRLRVELPVGGVPR